MNKPGCYAAAAILLLFTSIQTHATKTACLPQPIRTAIEQADTACGIKVVSVVRKGATIAGTKRPSLHSVCRAVDFTTKNVSCVYRVLASWPGKLSTDYHAVKHFHLDDGRYARFAHYQPKAKTKPKPKAKFKFISEHPYGKTHE